MPEISIIVPVYKVEQYLPRCIDSILAQIFKDFELLLIDDGSPDNSGKICDEYAQKDSRIRVFHKENGGVSSARNMGLDNACGKYVGFVDSDDSILPEMYETLLGMYRQNASIQLSMIAPLETGKEKKGIGANQFFAQKDAVDFMFSRYHHIQIWSKLFLRDNIGKTRFDKNVRIGEDILFLADYMKTVQYMGFNEATLYNYNITPNSAIHGGIKGDYLAEIPKTNNRLASKLKNSTVLMWAIKDTKGWLNRNLCSQPLFVKMKRNAFPLRFKGLFCKGFGFKQRLIFFLGYDETSILYKTKVFLWSMKNRISDGFIPVKGLIKSIFQKSRGSKDYPVDFVVTWVDGADEKWRKKKSLYDQEAVKSKDGEERFRDWDIFRYWFRAVEQYTPWVNKVFVITDDQVPDFLSEQCEKLVIVDHRDIIDSDCLPVFNSCAIEVNMHRIPGLSEHFVYFNDDIFITKPLSKSDFFHNGLPKYSATAKPIVPPTTASLHAQQVLRTVGLINREFKVKPQIKAHCEKWFSVKNMSAISANKQLMKAGYAYGFCFSHLGVPYRKSTWDTVSAHYQKEFHETSTHRFRSCFDVVHYLIIMWEMMNGEFETVKKEYYGKPFEINERNVADAINAIQNRSYRMICINDNCNTDADSYYKLKSKVEFAFERTFPTKSSFEK